VVAGKNQVFRTRRAVLNDGFPVLALDGKFPNPRFKPLERLCRRFACRTAGIGCSPACKREACHSSVRDVPWHFSRNFSGRPESATIMYLGFLNFGCPKFEISY
jgi:hypothetical protein